MRLLRFETAAIAADVLGQAFDGCLPVTLISAPPELGPPDEEGLQPVLTPSVVLAGYHVLSDLPGFSEEIAEIEDGVVQVTIDDAIIGCWLSPVPAGWPVEPLALPVAPDPGIALAALKDELQAQVDAKAETERLKYITAGAGQAMEYQQAAAEAERYLSLSSDPEFDPEAYEWPMLSASLGLDGATLGEVAQTVALMHQQWQTIGSAIRAARLRAKADIAAAPDAEAARAAAAVDWPVP